MSNIQEKLVNLEGLGAAYNNLNNIKLDKANVYNGVNQTSEGYALDARQGKSLYDKITNQVVISSAAISIPASGSSVSKNMSGLTSGHELVRWNFSASAENAPPVNLTWTTYNGYFTITNNGGSTSESIRPVFALPSAIATTAR